MRFGKSAQEAADDPRRGGGGDFIKYLRDGDNTMRILQEPEEWVHFWEHFSPNGVSFPCNNEEDCPGCTSTNEKTKKASKKVAFNILHSFNGTEYVDAMKVGPMVADKLDNRYKRLGTITDRDYTITRFKTKQDRYDFDVEGATPAPVDLRKSEWRDIESMLAEAWNDIWGDSPQAAANRQAVESAPAEPVVASSTTRRPTIAPAPAVASEEPPFEPEKAYNEADLRRMDFEDLVVLIQDEMKMSPPTTLKTSDAVVDWLMELES